MDRIYEMQSGNDEDARFWQNYLEGYPGLLNIALEYPRPPVQIFKKHVERIVLPLGEGSIVCSNQDFLTALFILLFRYTGQEDIVIGTLSPQCISERLEGQSGCSCEPLPLRQIISEQLNVRQLRDNVGRELEFVSHHRLNYPDELTERVRPDCSFTHLPLYQVVALPPEWPFEDATAVEVSVQMRYEFASFQASSDLAFQCLRITSGTELICEYDSNLWSTEQLRTILKHLGFILSTLDSCSDSAIRDLPLTEKDELDTLIMQWSHSDTKSSVDQGLVELVEAHIKSKPSAIAVRSENSILTYGELGERVDQLVARLRREGVSAEDSVGLYTGRCSAFPVSFLAIMKAGGVCVPLDMELPAERLHFILKDSGIKLILAQTHEAGLLSDVDLPIVYLDEKQVSSSSTTCTSEYIAAVPENLAYIIYTSGTTGTPKGVMIERGALVDLLVVQNAYFALGNETRMLWFASIGFDASVFEVLLPLLAGGTSLIAPPYARTDVDALVSFLHKYDVDIATLPPTLLAQIDPECCPKLRKIVSIGEDCPEMVAIKWSQGRVFYNGYGPTEGTIASTVASYAANMGKPPIGRPIVHRLIYVLDPVLQPVPVGVVGELFIGGNAIARGYQQRPSVTAESFLPDPFCPKQGMRMYKTGDLARYRPDGQLEYIGRSDHQVQLRGLRVEPGEVEAKLRTYSGVVDAVVVVQGSEVDWRLVAFITVNGCEQPTSHELRNYLRNLLPPQLVPVDYQVLDVLPTTPNGKLDRNLLSTLISEPSDAGNEFVAPRSADEKSVAEIWTKVLGIPRIGLNDDFFELGGYSLLTGKVISRVRDVFHVELEARDLFDAPTLTAFTAKIVNKASQGDTSQDLARLITTIEQMTEEEAIRALAERGLDNEN